MVEMRKIMSSFACFLTLSCGANIDLNAQSTQYIQHKAHIEQEQREYTQICDNIKMANLFYFIAYNDNNVDEQTIQGFIPMIKKVLKVSHQRMQKGCIDDENVYYSTLALYSFIKSRDIVGGIDILDNFSVVEYGKGVDKAREKLKATRA